MGQTVANAEYSQSPESGSGELPDILRVQKESWLKEGNASLETRIGRIDRCMDLLLENQDAVVEAAQSDWINKATGLVKLSEIMLCLNHARCIKKNIQKWMRPTKIKPDFPFNFLGAKTYIVSQPIGVVGVMAPWNGPLATTMIGVLDAFSAGNRVMVKTPELSPAMSEFMRAAFPKYFDITECAVVNGDVHVSRQFSELPFDHLIFTGSTSTARHIMAAAAKNLVPITLELGGKSPVIISESIANLQFAVRRTISGRLSNSGQGCITPDYVLVHKNRSVEFIELAREAIRMFYPLEKEGEDYASIATSGHYTRLQAMLDEAKESDAEVITIDVGATESKRQINPTLVINPPRDLKVAQEEIFGPILLVITVESLQEAIDYVNERPRPLALYYFGDDEEEKERVLTQTVSGGVSVNDVLMHLSMSNLPFGGVGHSGIGNYWGGDSGFKRFSHQKSIFEQGWFNKLSGVLDPPYGKSLDRLLKIQMKK